MAENEFVDSAGFNWADQPGFEWERPASTPDPTVTTVNLSSLVALAVNFAGTVATGVAKLSIVKQLGELASKAIPTMSASSKAITTITLKARVRLP